LSFETLYSCVHAMATLPSCFQGMTLYNVVSLNRKL